MEAVNRRTIRRKRKISREEESMSEEKKREILGQEKELDESEMEAVAGGYRPCRCIFEGYGEEKDGKSPCYAQGEGRDKSPCVCFEAGNSGDWKP